MAATDKPSAPNLTFAALDAEETPEPFVYVTKTNHRVTFPDIFEMPADEGQQFLIEVETKPDDEILEKWLTKADLEALKKDRLTLRQRMRLMEAVMSYYQSSLGTPGEEQASAS